ncbi:MAG TPA: hypothetical protein VE818_03190 [Nitrososphaeraceae archaeon]|nr:hypothetical protein [Nitrososphaeraceae archaeon]
MVEGSNPSEPVTILVLISSTIYPCPILNRYKCPFDKKKSNNNNNKLKEEGEKENSNLLDVDDLFNYQKLHLKWSLL